MSEGEKGLCDFHHERQNTNKTIIIIKTTIVILLSLLWDLKKCG